MEKQIIAEIKVVPLGTGSTSLSKCVVACIEVLKQFPNLKYELTAMGLSFRDLWIQSCK